MNQTTSQLPVEVMPTEAAHTLGHLVAEHGWDPRSVDRSVIQAHRFAHGLDGRPDLADTQLTHTHPAAKKQVRWGAAAVLVGFFALCGLGGVALASGGHSNSTNDRQFTAFEMCQKSVAQQLKAPSTAKFRDYFGDQAPTITGDGDGPFTVVSTVDSQNGFGAMIRSGFTCTATYVGNDQWNVTSTVE